MWFLWTIAYFCLGCVFWVALALPASDLWAAYWHPRQLRLKARDGERYRRYREERLFDAVDLAIIVISIFGAVALTFACRDWWGS